MYLVPRCHDVLHGAEAKMAMLAKQFQRAEAILLDHNELDEALAMYQAHRTVGTGFAQKILVAVESMGYSSAFPPDRSFTSTTNPYS